MSDGTEAAARSKAHEVIGAGNVGCGVEHRGEGHDAECGRVTALIVEHERALAVEKERVRLLDLALGNAKLRIASDEEACASIDRNLMRVAAERDALAAQLAEVTAARDRLGAFPCDCQPLMAEVVNARRIFKDIRGHVDLRLSRERKIDSWLESTRRWT